MPGVIGKIKGVVKKEKLTSKIKKGKFHKKVKKKFNKAVKYSKSRPKDFEKAVGLKL